jgi:hypothetical protein
VYVEVTEIELELLQLMKDNLVEQVGPARLKKLQKLALMGLVRSEQQEKNETWHLTEVGQQLVNNAVMPLLPGLHEVIAARTEARTLMDALETLAQSFREKTHQYTIIMLLKMMLRPFALAASDKEIQKAQPEQMLLLDRHPLSPVGIFKGDDPLTVGDLRRARACLREIEDGK